MEYAAEGSAAPMVALRDGRWKITVSDGAAPTLHDLEADPHERADLAADPAHAATRARLEAEVRARWDLAAFDAAVRASQARRRIVYEALRAGTYTPWDHQPFRRASERFMRNHMDLNVLESRQRFPRPVTAVRTKVRYMECTCDVHAMYLLALRQHGHSESPEDHQHDAARHQRHRHASRARSAARRRRNAP